MICRFLIPPGQQADAYRADASRNASQVKNPDVASWPVAQDRRESVRRELSQQPEPQALPIEGPVLSQMVAPNDGGFPVSQMRSSTSGSNQFGPTK